MTGSIFETQCSIGEKSSGADLPAQCL